MVVRDENPDDQNAIYDLIQAAFADREFSHGTEGPIVNGLRRDGDLTISLVALRCDVLVGYIGFSPASVAEHAKDIYALGPVATDPNLRHQGIGTALINEGLDRLQAMNAHACVLVGDPNYYQRFGFVGDCGLRSGSLPAAVVQALVWGEALPDGEISFAPAFSDASNHP